MPETLNSNQEQPIIRLPNRVNISDRFWIDFGDLTRTSDFVNSAKMPTIVLGIESRRDELVAERELLAHALVEPESPIAENQRRALEVGLMYGSMLGGRDQNPDSPVPGLPDGFAEDLEKVVEDIDLTTRDGAFELFMRLRDLEVKFAGSDVLAFSFAATQDHIQELFLGSAAESSLDFHQIVELQSLYYAGALVGALAVNDVASSQKPEIQIMRGRRDPVEQISFRTNFEQPDVALEDTVEKALRTKYGFVPSRLRGKSGLTVIPNSLQYGPNKKSEPIYIPGWLEQPSTCRIPTSKIDALLIGSSDQNLDTTIITLVREVDEFVDSVLDDEKHSEDEILGVIVDDFCVSAIDVAHPWALEIDKLVKSEVKTDVGIKYCTEVQLWEELAINRSVKRLNRLVMGLALAGAWVPEISGKLIMHDYEVNWEQGMAFTALVVGVRGLTGYVGKRINYKGNVRTARFDRLFQEHLDDVTLQGLKNSGNITP